MTRTITPCDEVQVLQRWFVCMMLPRTRLLGRRVVGKIKVTALAVSVSLICYMMWYDSRFIAPGYSRLFLLMCTATCTM